MHDTTKVRTTEDELEELRRDYSKLLHQNDELNREIAGLKGLVKQGFLRKVKLPESPYCLQNDRGFVMDALQGGVLKWSDLAPKWKGDLAVVRRVLKCTKLPMNWERNVWVENYFLRHNSLDFDWRELT